MLRMALITTTMAVASGDDNSDVTMNTVAEHRAHGLSPHNVYPHSGMTSGGITSYVNIIAVCRKSRM